MAKKEKGEVPGVDYSLRMNEEGHLVAVLPRPEFRQPTHLFLQPIYHVRRAEQQAAGPRPSRGPGLFAEDHAFDEANRQFSVSRKGEFRFHIEKSVDAYSEARIKQMQEAVAQHGDEAYCAKEFAEMEEDGVRFRGSTMVHSRHHSKIFGRTPGL